jgi:hypothetical protein
VKYSAVSLATVQKVLLATVEKEIRIRLDFATVSRKNQEKKNQAYCFSEIVNCSRGSASCQGQSHPTL